MPDIPDIERILFTYRPDGTLHGAAAWNTAGSVTALSPDGITALAPWLNAAANAGIEAYRSAAADAEAAQQAAEAAREEALAAKAAAEEAAEQANTQRAATETALAAAEARIAELTAPPAVATVTRAQMRIWLHRANLLDAVEAQIAAGPREAQIDWQDRQTYRRDHPLVAQLGTALGLSAAEIDAAFTAAAAIS